MKDLILPQTNVVEELDFSLMFNNCTIDLEKQYELPPLAISIGRNDNGYPLILGTYGNISLINGEEKSRKSFFKSLIEACTIGGNAVNYSEDIKGHNLKDRYIISLDGEQDEFYAYSNGVRIPKMVGALPENYKVLKLREYTKRERSQFLEWLFMESSYRKKLGVVFLDGYVDFCKNFNDLEESDLFTQSLMKYSSLANCHISGILHLNPGTEKARGHLGTILQQKCETVVIVKDGGDFSIVECKRARGIKFDAFAMRINEKGLPYVSTDFISKNSPNKNLWT